MSFTRFFVAAVVGLGAIAAFGPVANAKPNPELPCARTVIAKRTLPSGPAQYQSGSLRLLNGATLRVNGTPAALSEVMRMRSGDSVAACYGPPASYADAGPSRTITVLDLRNGAFYGALVGTWMAQR